MTTRSKKAILMLGDTGVLFLTLWLTMILRYTPAGARVNFEHHLPHFSLIFAIWLFILYIGGLYNLNWRQGGRRFFRALANSALLSSLLSIIYFYLNVRADIAPRTNLMIFIAVFLLLFIAWRYLYRLIFALVPRNNLGFIGEGERAVKLLEELKNNPSAGYGEVFIFKTAPELSDLKAEIGRKNLRALVLLDDFGESERVRQALFDCLDAKLNFYSYPDFYESLSGKIPIEAINQDWFLDNLHEGAKDAFNFFKRLTDFTLAALLLLVSLPFWMIIAIAIKAESRGPVFFKQKRLGLGGHVFWIIKFRTMRSENNTQSPTAIGDARITKFGNFLRKTRIDEIPQVLNILRNEMSFIGPRPERPELAIELEKQIPFYRTRLLLKPGVTGWDQVSGHYHSPSLEDTLEKLQYDLFYLKHRSFYLDLIIILKTAATMIARSGR